MLGVKMLISDLVKQRAKDWSGCVAVGRGGGGGGGYHVTADETTKTRNTPWLF